MKYLVGINVRVSGVDCVLADEKGAILRTQTEPYEMSDPRSARREQNPGDWWTAAAGALSGMLEGCDTSQIAAVGVSGEMHGLVALDAENQVVRNAVLWGDAQTEEEYNNLIGRSGVDALLENPHHTLPKLLWLKKNEPETYAKIARFVMPADYIRYLLTGNLAADQDAAASSGYFNTEDQEWDNEIISKVGFDIVIFPPVADSNAPLGTVTEEAAQSTGLPAGIPVYSVGAETSVRNACLHILNERGAALMLGSSGVVAAQMPEIPRVGGSRLETISIGDGDSYIVYGRQLACGDALAWAEEALFGLSDDPELALYEAAENAAPGSNGVVFLPYLMGERSPQPNPHAKAVFYGMNMRTAQPQLARAVMEGIVFGLKEIYDYIQHENRKVQPEELIISGSASGSSLLKHIIADVFQLPVKVYQGALEGGAYGAALTAGVGEGLFESLEDAEKLHHIAEVIEPDAETGKMYTDSRNTFHALCHDLRKTFDEA